MSFYTVASPGATATTVTVGDCNYGTEYTFEIRAAGSGGTYSAFSNQVTATALTP